MEIYQGNVNYPVNRAVHYIDNYLKECKTDRPNDGLNKRKKELKTGKKSKS